MNLIDFLYRFAENLLTNRICGCIIRTEVRWKGREFVRPSANGGWEGNDLPVFADSDGGRPGTR
jgi:hypothetical protein